jgi:hypothetical protein
VDHENHIPPFFVHESSTPFAALREGVCMFSFLNKFFGKSSSRSRSSASRPASFRPQLESLGGTGGSTWARTSSPSRRPSFMPAVEQLEQREVLSASGTISAITDGQGYTSVFALANNGTVMQNYNGSQWVGLGNAQLVGTSFKQISAGLDSGGNAICFAISSSNELWGFTSYTGSNSVVDLHGWVSQISAGRHGECYATGWNHDLWVNSMQQPGWSGLVYTTETGGFVQLSAGIDQYGNDEVYCLTGADHVLQYKGYGNFHWMGIQANQISAGIGQNSTGTDLYYISPSGFSFYGTTYHYTYHCDGVSAPKYIAAGFTDISAGVDGLGQSTLYGVYVDGSVYRCDLNGNDQAVGGPQVTQISAAGRDQLFAVSTSGPAYGSGIYTYDPWGAWYDSWSEQSINYNGTDWYRTGN